MEIPGGILIDGDLKRSFEFKPVTGFLELWINERSLQQQCHSARITTVLCEALAHLGGEAVSPDRVRDLNVGDRQYLMRRLAVHIDDQVTWLTATCGECGEPFDVSLRYAELPVKPAGDEFPETIVDSSLGRLHVRVPTGADQEIIAAIADDREAMWVLLEQLLSHEHSRLAVDPRQLGEEEITAIETVVENLCPEIATHLTTNCPHCDNANHVSIHPYTIFERSLNNVYGDVHILATTYHWSEEEILALTRSRRHTYLSMIDRSRGMNARDRYAEAG